MNDDENLNRKIASIPRNIEPERDLWPAIEARLTHAGPRAVVRRVVRWSLAAAAVISAAFFGWRLLSPSAYENVAAWQVRSVEGTPRIASKSVEGSALFHRGEWLETDGSSRAEIAVGSIGRVEVGPNTRIHLVATSDNNHRLSLAEGEIHAVVSAPPRLFFVETPSAMAVDLGCAYALRVDKRGEGTLDVLTGLVAFEWRGRHAVIPAGMSCFTRPDVGPGTPFLDDAPEKFRTALEEYDFGNRGFNVLKSVLEGAREDDILTLWHLLFRVEKNQRAMVYDRLAEFVSPPKGTTREGTLAGDAAMINAWQEEVGLGSFYTWEFNY
jgi:hypothetical protein